MVELRKRKTQETDTPLPPAKKSSVAKSTSAGKKDAASANGPASTPKVESGSSIDLSDFGGEIQTQEGVDITLKSLVDESKNGVVLFTYPKASTPGCTTQACLFRDEYTSLTSTGFSIYGLSTDSPKSNTNFKSKQNLPYTLLCDPAATLIKAIGFKKVPSGTTRGVFVIDKDGKVTAVSAGGPAATVDVVRKLIEAQAGGTKNVETIASNDELETNGVGDKSNAKDAEQHNADGDEVIAEVAAEVADTSEKLDEGANE
ncbi:thioredoxin peroxidase dot5 [Lecanora helva]